MSQQQCKTVVVVGERAVGKSAIVNSLLDDTTTSKFDFSTYRPTIDDCYNVVWKLPADGKYVQVQLIDTAAWNEFPAMQSLYIKMSHLVIVVYDVVNPNWRSSLLTVINGVRSIKDDADIFIVGNKCDKLKVTDSFTPSDLSEVIGHSCVGHVYTSALTQQGIAGMKQLILCSKSQLTEGHYTEFSSFHKKKKLKKKLNGLALAWKFTRKQKGEDKTDNAPKYRQPIVYPEEPHYVAYTDLTANNFDKLFDAAEIGRGQYRKNQRGSKPNKQVEKPIDCKRRQSTAFESGSTSDYSSPGTSPNNSSYDCTPPYHKRGHRKSMDFSYIIDSYNHSPINRQRSQSHGNEAGYARKPVDVTSSISTIMSDSSNDSVSYETGGPTRPQYHKVLVEKVRMREKDPSRSRQRLRRSSALSYDSSTESLLEEEPDYSRGETIRSTLSNPEGVSTKSAKQRSPDTIAEEISQLHISDDRSGKRKSPARHIRHRSDGQIMY